MFEEEADGNELVVLKLRKDLAKAAAALTTSEARYLVNLYYQIQHYRIAAAAQTREAEVNATLHFLFQQMHTLEMQAKRALDLWTRDHAVSQWARGICGIGPVIAAGLRAHIDITKAPTVGHIWAFAGLDPSKTWGRGNKRPWNGELKLLCWKIGESFVKVSGREADFYGKLYLKRKAYEAAKNEAGDYAEQAKVGTERVSDKTQSAKHYAAGKLPPGHLHSRARRYAVKLFLSHYHHVAYFDRYGELPPKPYALAMQDHVHEIAAPHFNEWRAAMAR